MENFDNNTTKKKRLFTNDEILPVQKRNFKVLSTIGLLMIMTFIFIQTHIQIYRNTGSALGLTITFATLTLSGISWILYSHFKVFKAKYHTQGIYRTLDWTNTLIFIIISVLFMFDAWNSSDNTSIFVTTIILGVSFLFLIAVYFGRRMIVSKKYKFDYNISFRARVLSIGLLSLTIMMSTFSRIQHIQSTLPRNILWSSFGMAMVLLIGATLFATFYESDSDHRVQVIKNVFWRTSESSFTLMISGAFIAQAVAYGGGALSLLAWLPLLLIAIVLFWTVILKIYRERQRNAKWWYLYESSMAKLRFLLIVSLGWILWVTIYSAITSPLTQWDQYITIFKFKINLVTSHINVMLFNLFITGFAIFMIYYRANFKLKMNEKITSVINTIWMARSIMIIAAGFYSYAQLTVNSGFVIGSPGGGIEPSLMTEVYNLVILAVYVMFVSFAILHTVHNYQKVFKSKFKTRTTKLHDGYVAAAIYITFFAFLFTTKLTLNRFMAWDMWFILYGLLMALWGFSWLGYTFYYLAPKAKFTNKAVMFLGWSVGPLYALYWKDKKYDSKKAVNYSLEEFEKTLTSEIVFKDDLE